MEILEVSRYVFSDILMFNDHDEVPISANGVRAVQIADGFCTGIIICLDRQLDDKPKRIVSMVSKRQFKTCYGGKCD